MKTLVWEGCYDDPWKGVIPDAAFEHPAKFSQRLVERIIEHMETRGWLVKGEVIADPFAGVRLGGVIAAYRGYQWIGQELEERFMQLGDQVFERHRARWKALGVPAPICFKGDSRRFDETLKNTVGAVVSSPPYVSGGHHTDVFEAWNTNGRGQNGRGDLHGYGRDEGQIGTLKQGEVDAVVASPPYNLPFAQEHSGKRGGQRAKGKGKRVDARSFCIYGSSEGQIDSLVSGEVAAVISSPPYEDIAAGAGGLNTKPAKHGGQQSGRRKGASQSGDQRYGKTEGQISRAQKGPVGAVLTSPPYENSLRAKEHGFDFAKAKPDYPGRIEHASRVAQHSKSHDNRRYGDESGQIGKLKKQTYWEAMRDVYVACFWSLKPRGVMAIVVKDFVKNGKRQRLCDDTLKLLKHLGFEPIERVRAMLVKTYVVPDLFEGSTTRTKERKSFFRRHLESKMGPDDPRRINWEEVLFVRKPA